MYIAFEDSNGSIVDFPFRTPSELAMKILDTETDEEILAIVMQQLHLWGWSFLEIIIDLDELKEKLNNPDLTITALP